jgi:hypothetical protein
MSRKIIFFVALFYFLTFMAAFVMAAPKTKASGEETSLTRQLEKARDQSPPSIDAEAREEDLEELEKELDAEELEEEAKKEEDLAELEQEKEIETVPIEEDPFLKEAETAQTSPQAEEISPELAEEPLPIPDDPTEKAKEEEIKVENNNKVVLEEVSQKESPQWWGFTLMGGSYRPDKYKGRGDDRFDQISEGQDWFLNNKRLWNDLALEWQFFRLFGTLAAKLSSGICYIEPNHDPSSVEGTLKQKYRLFAVPLTVGGVYRLHFWSNQPIIPFAEGGGGSVTFRQTTAPAADRYKDVVRRIYVAGVGVQINGNFFDPKAARSFDINWGVNRTHFIAEARIIRSLDNDKFDFSGQDLFTAGLLFEF